MFLDRLDQLAARRPEAAALVRGSTTLSYADLMARVEDAARRLTAQGVGLGDVAGLTIGDEFEHLLACLGLMRVGATQITLGTQDPAGLRERLGVRVGVTCHVGPGPDVNRIAPARPADVEGLATEDRPALILPGSGTTGDVKLVSLSGAQIATQASITYADYGRDRILQLAPVEFNNGKRLRLYCLWHGGASIFRAGGEASLQQLCRDQGATWFDMSAYHARDLVRASAVHGRLPEATAVRIGGSRVSNGLRADFIRLVSERLYISYGATEIGGMPGICMAAPDELVLDAERVGKPLAGMGVVIVDGDGRPVPPDTIGEVRIRAPGMVDRYIGDAVATARCFRDGWFQPGDLMSMAADGMLTFHGRSDDMIILNSINIFPGEIERTLETHPAVFEAAAYPLASGVHGQIPVATVELRPGAVAGERELLAFARERLGLRAPRKVAIVAQLPRSGQGKVLKRVLAEGGGVRRPE